MKIFRRTEAAERRARFLEEARSHLGYKTRPGGVSDFGQTVGYAGHDIPWDGAFIDVIARNAGVVIPACVQTGSGLAEFAMSRRVRLTPAPGDIVFFSFPATGMWGQPHVGIVTDPGLGGGLDMQTGYFRTIEAQVSSGLPRASADRVGIFERTRWVHEVIAFARPDFKARPGRRAEMQTGKVSVRLNRVRPGSRARDVQTVQLALTYVAGLRSHEPGIFDRPTQDAYARWERQIGRVGSDAIGTPDQGSLERLGRETGLFSVRES